MQVTVYTDGSVLKPNPGGPGGFGIAIVKGIEDVKRPSNPDDLLCELSGKELSTTNQRMEMRGALHGLDAAIRLGATEILFVSDSEYVIKGITEWMPNWKRRDWRTASGTMVKNLDLWLEIDRIVTGTKALIRYQHVRGHQDTPWNSYADESAGKMSAEAKREKQAILETPLGV